MVGKEIPPKSYLSGLWGWQSGERGYRKWGSVFFNLEGVAFGAGAAVNGWATAAYSNGVERTGFIIIVVVGAVGDAA